MIYARTIQYLTASLLLPIGLDNLMMYYRVFHLDEFWI